MAKVTVAKAHKLIRAWLIQPDNRVRLLERPRAVLQTFVKGHGEPTADVARALWSLSVWLTNHGAEKAFQQDAEAANVYLDGLLCELLAIETERHMNSASRNGRPKLNIDRVATCLLALLSLGNVDDARDLYRLMEAGLESQLFYDPPAAFNIAEFGLALGRDVVRGAGFETTVGCTAYRRLVENWRTTDTAAISDLMLDALNQHEKLAGDRANAEFDRPVYWIFPVEVSAVRRLREAAGLANPKLSHSLWKSPLCQLSATREFFEDELLQRVDQMLKSVTKTSRAINSGLPKGV